MTTQTSRTEGKEINKAWFYFVISLFVFRNYLKRRKRGSGGEIGFGIG